MREVEYGYEMEYDDDKKYKKPKVGIESSEEFRLNPSIPKNRIEQDWYDRYWPMIGHTAALSNLQQSDLWIRNLHLQNIQSKINYGDINWARDDMIQELSNLQGTRGLEGFETRFGRQGIQRSESEIRERRVDLTPTQQKVGKMSGLFRGKQKQEAVE